jgi:uncharacterized SAM-dependent methyltransferase
MTPKSLLRLPAAASRIEELATGGFQTVTIAGESIAFREGEHIVTEYSHKYSAEQFVRLAREAGWKPEAVWTDDEDLFSVHYLTVA